MDPLVCPLCHIALPAVDDVCPRDGHAGREVAWMPVPRALEQRFQVLEPFAHSETGSLYIADEPETCRRGLLKILAPVAGKDALAERQRLRRELVKQATLPRTNLVVPLASGESEGATWIFREWLDGVSLEVRLSRGGALQQTEALAIAAQVATALDELHRGGLLHRDVKPGHIFLQPTPQNIPRAMLLDAGVARTLPTRGPGAAALIYGTAGYVAPEQLLGKLVSFRSDLYSLGCVLYRMLTGRPAFAGDSLDETLAAQRYGELPPMPADLPSGIGALLESILAKDPQQRPFSAQKLRRTLDPFLPDGALMEKQSTTTFETVPQPKPSIAPQPSGTLRPPPPPSVRPSPAEPASAGLRPPTHSAAPPAPPKSGTVREERTQQIDLSQIEELRPVAPRAASVPPPTPHGSRTPSAPKSAAISEKTQPIRLDQILAVAQARRAATSTPPPTRQQEEAAAEAARAVEAARKAEAARTAAEAARKANAAQVAEAARGAEAARRARPSQDAEAPATATSPSLSQRPLFAVQDEPFAPPIEQEAPALFETPPRSFAVQASSAAPVARPAASTPAGPTPVEALSGSGIGPRTALPSAAALAEGAARPSKATMMGMGSDLRRLQPALDPSLETPTQELHTRDFDREREHPTERISLATPSEASERDSSDGVAMSLPEGAHPSHGRLRAARHTWMYAGAAVVGLAVLGLGASALFSGPEESAEGRPVEAQMPPPLPAMVAATEPATAAVALAEAPRPTVEPLAPSMAELPPDQTAPAAQAGEDTAPSAPASAQAQSATEPTPVVAVRDEATEPTAEEDRRSAKRERASRREKARRESASAKSSSTKGSSTKSSPTDKAAQFAAARDEARTHYSAKRYKEAAAAYERAARLDPKNPGTFAGLGAARLQLGEPKAAVQAYQRAVQLSPDTSGFHAALGRAYLSLGDKSKAIASYKRALSIDPKNEPAKAALKQLGS